MIHNPWEFVVHYVVIILSILREGRVVHVLLQGIMKASASVLDTDTPKLQDTHTKRAQLGLAWVQVLG